MPKKIYQFFVHGLLLEPKILGLFLCSFITGTKPNTVHAVSEEALLEAVGNGRSIIRLGDGETMILMGRDIHFQPYSPELRSGLDEIITNYTDQAPYIIGSPIDQLAAADNELKTIGRMRIWRLFRIYFQHKFPQTTKYCSLVLFYHQNTFEKKIASALADRHVICVGNKKVLDQKLRAYFSSNFPQATFVTAPSYDAFKEEQRICKEIDLTLAEHPDIRPVILMAIGPASKVIAYKYAMQGVQALDIGHGMEIIAQEKDYSNRI
jgi:hypothetical protein